MHMVWFDYFSQNIRMFKYLYWKVLLLTCHTDGMYHIWTYFIKSIVFYMKSHWPWSFEWNSSFLRANITRFYLYLYVYCICGHVQLCTNDYLDSVSAFAKEDNFVVYVLFIKYNIWDVLPMVSISLSVIN